MLVDAEFNFSLKGCGLKMGGTSGSGLVLGANVNEVVLVLAGGDKDSYNGGTNLLEGDITGLVGGDKDSYNGGTNLLEGTITGLVGGDKDSYNGGTTLLEGDISGLVGGDSLGTWAL